MAGFEGNLVDDPAERWANLPAEKRALVEERLRNSGLSGASARRLGPRPSATTTPLSFAQERLWFMDQLEPGSLAYNRPWAVRLKGRLAPDALEAALNSIISRHEPLRTTFTAVDGLPVQAVQTHHDLPLSMVDLSQLSAAEREREAVRRTIEHSRQPFDLARDPMLRPALLRLGTQDHVLLLTTHHIAFDGWSEAVLLHELSVRYAALLRGSDSLLPVLPLQYGDFAYWQRQSLQGEVLERLSSYWKRVLAGAPDVLDLRADHPRPVSQTNRGARLTTRVDGKTLEVLKALGRRTGATLFMSLLTAFQAVLAVRASQMNLLVGCPVAGRNRPELEDLIGFFVDMLVVRADLSGDPTWIDLVARTRRSTLEALAHQDLPFAKLVEILAPRRDLSHLALVQATFQLRNLPKAETRMAEVDLLPFEFDPGLARYDLSLEAEERDGGLTCRLVYNLDLFEEATALRFLSTFERALIAMTADPDQRLSSLRDLLDEREQGRAVPTAPRELEEDLGGPSNLTRNQMRTWLGEQVWPGLPLYNVPFTFSISRSLDALHFQRAFQGLVDRSDALRTVVEVVGGIPQQRVLPGLSFEALCLDFSSRADPEGEARAWAQARCEIPLELDRRLFDCALLRCGPSHSFWYLNLHHLITDLASIHQIFETMQGFYWRSVEGSLDAAPGLPAFAEYIGYERGLRRALLKSTAAPRPQGRSGRPESMRFYGRHPGEWTTRVEGSALELGSERSRRLKALALESDYFTKTPDASLLNLIATALFAFLYRVTDRHQLALGVPFHNRREPYAKTLGLLMEFIPFQVMVEDGETFRSLAHKVIQNASELVGRGILAESLASGTKAFEVSLNYLNAVFDRFLEAPAITQYLSHGHDDDTLSVRLEDYEGTGNLRFGFLFNAGMFSREQQGRAVRHFELMLDAFLSDPGLRLDSVDLVTPEEKELQLRPTFKTGPPPPAYTSVVGAFEAQVRKAPEAVALVDGERSLSYGKLNSLANQWARRLRAEGIRPGVTVGVCMGRSVEWLIALLGVLKAGGVYLPLDPSLPRERLRATLEDADAPLVLTQHPWADLLAGLPFRLVNLGKEGGAAASLAGDDLVPQAGPTDPAYVIYTSGSTGKPKGVLVEHRSLSNFTLWAAGEYGLHPGDRVLQFSSISWDTSLEETVPALISGATLVLRQEGMLDSYAGFLKKVGDLGLTVLTFATAFWHELIEAMAADTLAMPENVRLIVFGGGRASRERLRTWRAIVQPHGAT
ncbi:MAG: hypothetical protein HW376_126 [candidate division NC10 bacterium]|nr:hypothetical protein [candidate division NC10 bacterium]